MFRKERFGIDILQSEIFADQLGLSGFPRGRGSNDNKVEMFGLR